jgi:hypothetical protein
VLTKGKQFLLLKLFLQCGICFVVYYFNPLLIIDSISHHRFLWLSAQIWSTMSTSEIYKVSIPGSAYTSGAPEFTAEFSKDRVTRGLVLCVMFCRFCPFVLFLLTIVLSVPRFTATLITPLVPSNSSYLKHLVYDEYLRNILAVNNKIGN